MVILLLLALAIAPGLAICIYVFGKDKFEKEPLHLLVKCFFLGILSAVPAIILSKTGEAFLKESLFLNVFIGVALSEEFSKFLFLRFYAFPKNAFNEPYDGIIYSVMISMGFATIENILYTFEGGISVGVLRMFTAVPGHATFAILMGYFVGLAKFNKEKKLFYLLAGLFSAAALHGLYDYCLFQQDYPLMTFGALISLILGIYLSRKAMQLHAHQSPFNPTKPPQA
jgi:protease PrsW